MQGRRDGGLLSRPRAGARARIEWDCAVFTNLTQDHLDYHGTMENYFDGQVPAVHRLAAQKKKAKAVINSDDRTAPGSPKFASVPVITYGGRARGFSREQIKTDFSGTSYQLDAHGKSFLVRLPLMGRFNVYNSLAALAAACAIGSMSAAVRGLANAPHVPGRLEAVPAKRQFRVFVDYAHTEDALLNVMKTLRELSPDRLIVVFGCGGNRDRPNGRRWARPWTTRGLSIITSDNPRKEDPEAIIEEIKKGFRGAKLRGDRGSQGGHFQRRGDRAAARHRADRGQGPRDVPGICGHTMPLTTSQAQRPSRPTPWKSDTRKKHAT